jgi:nucleoside-diphosphate-sugar epimerase
MASRMLSSGFEVRALVRDASSSRAVADRGWTPVVGDLSSRDSLHAAVNGVDCVVHSAAYLGTDHDLARKINVDGTRQLAEEALDAGVRRFVHISTMSVHGEPQPDGLREESPLVTKDPRYAYVESKSQAELAVLDVQARGLKTVILRPGAICSAVHSQWGDEMVGLLRKRGWPKDFHPDDVIPWVHTENLAEMTWLAVTHPVAANQTFLAVDQNVAIRDFFVPVAKVLGCPITIPDRPPVVSSCHVGKIAVLLGYKPTTDFATTLGQLIELARQQSIGGV